MITFEAVKKRFGQKVVLDGLSFHVEPGKITFILGKSGEGKSVTLKHILGLMEPDAGRVVVDGRSVAEMNPEAVKNYRRRFGMLFQHAALFDSLTVYENIEFPLIEQNPLPRRQRHARIVEVMQQVGVVGSERAYPSELSTGEKKRVGLARALAPRPDFLLYDEPTTGMDPLIAEMIDRLIVKVARENPHMTSVVISHDLKAALATGDHLIMLYQGKVVLAGAPPLFRESEDPVIRQFFSGSVHGPMLFM
ncbi:MAG: ATP-binding cassette domain-containing protein [Zetaproteobacteria bacterium]|nr:ATP-binding cassette domain-containing protein [Zetaproteobacteria bacterium]